MEILVSVKSKINDLEKRKSEIEAVLKEFDKEGNEEPLITTFSLELEKELEVLEKTMKDLKAEERIMTLEREVSNLIFIERNEHNRNVRKRDELSFEIQDLETRLKVLEKRREKISMILWYIILILPCVIVVGFIALRIFTFITK